MSPTEFFFLNFRPYFWCTGTWCDFYERQLVDCELCLCRTGNQTTLCIHSALFSQPEDRMKENHKRAFEPSWNLPSNCRYVFPWHRCLLSISHLQPVRLSARFVSYISVMRIKRRWWQAAERRGFVLALKSDTVWVRDLCSWWSSWAGR